MIGRMVAVSHPKEPNQWTLRSILESVFALRLCKLETQSDHVEFRRGGAPASTTKKNKSQKIILRPWNLY